MGTARREPADLLLGVLREIGLTVLGWLGALTALYVVFRAILPSIEDSLARVGATDRIGDVLPGGDGSLFAGWLDWLGAYLGGDPGRSIVFARPVGEVVGDASGLSITLLLVMVVVTVLLGAMAFAIAARLGNRGRRPVAMLAYGLGLLLPVVGLLFVLWLALTQGLFPQSLTPPPESTGTIEVGTAVVVSVVVALPVVGDVIRRVHRAGAGTQGRIDVRALLDRGRRGLGTVELWTYLLYLASALVVVERVFQYPGLGFMLHEAVISQDYPLLFGIGARLVAILAVLALVRNLGWTVAQYVSDGRGATPSSRSAAGDGADRRGDHQPDGGRSPSAGPGGPGGGSPAPTAGTLWRAFANRTKARAAAGLFALAALLALVGLATGPVDPQLLGRPPFPGITPTLLAQTTASVLVGTLVAVLLAVVLGVLPGLIAGVADARGGRLPSVLAGLLRVPSEAALLVPMAVAGILWLITFPPAAASLSIELAIGTITGLGLTGFAFRAVYEAARDAAVPGRPTMDWITESLMAGGARLDFVTATTAFAATELVFLGMVPVSDDVYAGVVQLETAFRQGLFTLGEFPVGVLLLPILGAAPVLLGLYLLGDGLGEALWSVRSGEPAAAGGGPRASGRHPSGEQQPSGSQQGSREQRHPPADGLPADESTAEHGAENSDTRDDPGEATDER